MKKGIITLFLWLLMFGIAAAQTNGVFTDCKFDDGTDRIRNCTGTIGSIAVNTDYFPADICVNSTKPRMLIFEITPSTSTVVKLLVTDRDGDITAKTYEFNSGAPIIANTTGTFSKILFRDQCVNFQHETGTQNVAVEIVSTFHIQN